MKKFVFYYIRFSLCLHLLLLAVSLGFVFGSADESMVFIVIFFTCVVIEFPAFFILPGIIYANYKYPYHGFTLDQFKYSLFFGITAGLGPLIIYFIKYDKDLEKFVNRENLAENHSH